MTKKLLTVALTIAACAALCGAVCPRNASDEKYPKPNKFPVLRPDNRLCPRRRKQRLERWLRGAFCVILCEH